MSHLDNLDLPIRSMTVDIEEYTFLVYLKAATWVVATASIISTLFAIFLIAIASVVGLNIAPATLYLTFGLSLILGCSRVLKWIQPRLGQIEDIRASIAEFSDTLDLLRLRNHSTESVGHQDSGLLRVTQYDIDMWCVEEFYRGKSVDSVPGFVCVVMDRYRIFDDNGSPLVYSTDLCDRLSRMLPKIRDHAVIMDHEESFVEGV